MATGNGLRALAWISVIILLIITVYISRFLTGTVLLGILLAYMLLPVYKLAFMKTGSERRSSLIAILMLLITAVLTLLVLYLIISHGLSGPSANITNNITSSNPWANLGILPSFKESQEMVNFKNAVQGGMVSFLISYIVPAVVHEVVTSWIIPILQSKAVDYTLAFPIILIQLIVSIFLAYYLLLNGKDAALRSSDLLPEEQRWVGRYFLDELNGVYKILLTANFDIAAYNALVGIIIFSLIGVPFSLAWAIMAAFLSLIRFFGPWLIFLPLSVLLFLTNDVSKGFFLLLFGSVLLEYVPEHILRPSISKGRSPVNIALAFLSYVAPILVFGLMGIVIGPFVYGLLIAAYRTAQRYREKEGS
ncbi:MAG: AI-2E family transporter [Methanotrichaceae archaeon]